MTLYPWQTQQWEMLSAITGRDRFPHALLLTGPEGTGIRQFAEALSARLLCDQPDLAGFACGGCRSCDLYAAGSHPDIHRVEREGPGKQIKVDSIREMIAFIQLSTHRGRHKIAIIEPAEAMNAASANALLKTLEEPPGSSVLVLVSHRPGALPATVRSRCQRILFHPVFGSDAARWLAVKLDGDRAAAEQLLALSNGAPLQALESADTKILEQHESVLDDLVKLGRGAADPVATAQRWSGIGAEEVLRWLISVVVAMARGQLPGGAGSSNNSLYGRHLQQLANGLHLPQIVDCYDVVLGQLHAATGRHNLSRQCVLEEVAAHWQSLNRSRGGRQS